MIQIQVSKQLRFSEGQKSLLANVLLEEGAITALYGNSGAGKTTLLKIIAGLMQPDSGRIEVNPEVWLDTDKKINVKPQQRSIGFVFQDYALFPNMTVLQNLQYAAGKNADETFIHDLVHLVSLQAFIHSKPSQLSGGQQQRVALIRALVRKPKLLLLDEPLAALDTKLRYNLHTALRQLQQQLRFTALLVSHDAGEVYALAKQVIHLEEGQVVFQGTPQQLFGAHRFSHQLQLTGEVVSIVPNGVIYMVELLVGTGIIRLTATAGEVAAIKTGDLVWIDAKAFHVGMKKMR